MTSDIVKSLKIGQSAAKLLSFIKLKVEEGSTTR